MGGDTSTSAGSKMRGDEMGATASGSIAECQEFSVAKVKPPSCCRDGAAARLEIAGPALAELRAFLLPLRGVRLALMARPLPLVCLLPAPRSTLRGRRVFRSWTVSHVSPTAGQRRSKLNGAGRLAAARLRRCGAWPARSPRRSGRACGSAASTCRGTGRAASPRSLGLQDRGPPRPPCCRTSRASTGRGSSG